MANNVNARCYVVLVIGGCFQLELMALHVEFQFQGEHEQTIASMDIKLEFTT